MCQVLGAEPVDGTSGGKLGHLRYPAQPASSAYRPENEDIARIVLGELKGKKSRALDIATLANRPEVDVSVDGHFVVTRHLAVLAMTGAGKSWTVRRLIEQLADKKYPMVIFDPHGDYTGLAELDNLKDRVSRYYAQFPVFDEPADHVRRVIESLSSYELAKTQAEHFETIFGAAKAFVSAPKPELDQRTAWLSTYLQNPSIAKYGLRPDLYFLADFVQREQRVDKDQSAFQQIEQFTDTHFSFTPQQAGWLEGLLTVLGRRLRPFA